MRFRRRRKPLPLRVDWEIRWEYLDGLIEETDGIITTVNGDLSVEVPSDVTVRRLIITPRLLDITGEPIAPTDAMRRAWDEAVNGQRALIADGIEAFRLTREYVHEETLPAIEGWSWFDWTERARRYLETHR